MRRFLLSVLVLVACVPAAAEDCKPLRKYATIPFKDDGSGRISLPATLAGRSTRLTLDTGAYWSGIRTDLVEALKLRTKTSYDIVLYDAAGNKADKLAIVPEVKVGPLNFGMAEFFINGVPGNALPMDEDGGLMGQNLMTQVDLEIDNADQTISLYTQDHCPAAGVHWANEAVVLPYKRRPGSANVGSRLRRDVGKNQIDEPIVVAEVQGKPLTVLFDTGASSTVMDSEVAKNNFNIHANSPGAEPGDTFHVASGASVSTFKYTFKSLTISGIEFHDVPVYVGNFSGGAVEGDANMILGMNEMQHLHLFFAFKEGVIYATAARTGKPAAQK